MSRAKKTKAPQRHTELDKIVTQLRTILRRQTSDVVSAGNLLIRARKLFANEHGEWKEWLAENFNLSYQTALNYCATAKYVEGKSQTFDIWNLSAGVLYALAAGDFNEQEEAAILAASRKGRVGRTRADEICEALQPANADDAEKSEGDQSDQDGDDSAEDAEIEAILAAGTDPALPPPAPNPPPINFALRDFDEAISALKRLRTKPLAQFARTIHSTDDLKDVESFIHVVVKALTKEPTTTTSASASSAAKELVS